VAGPHILLWDGLEYYLTKPRKALGPLVGRKTFSVGQVLVSDGWKLDELYYSSHRRPLRMVKHGYGNIAPQRRPGFAVYGHTL
jgi:hypothetical protein